MARPDAVDALNDCMVQRVLPRYIKVIKNELPPNFQILKRVECEREESLSNDELWKVHGELMRKFRVLKEDGILENSGNPRYSLLDLKILLTRNIMKKCELCERKCKINRFKGEKGICKVGSECRISSEFAHFGEEPYITPSHTIFFMGCNLHCQYCQNWTISQQFESGISVTPDILAKAIDSRKVNGARNVNFVGGEPTPNMLWILQALRKVRENVPVIWNSNMYMSVKAMKILEGVVDMYLTDFKYGNDKCAERLSKVKKYWQIVSRNHLLASQQAEMTVRHLVLPNHAECCTRNVIKWLERIKGKFILNLMDQYRPDYKAAEYPEINHSLKREEFNKAVKLCKGLDVIT